MAARPPGPTRPIPSWRSQVERGPTGRRRQFLIVAALLLLTVAGIAQLISWLDPVSRPYLLVVGASPASATIPQWPNDARALSNLDGFTKVSRSAADPGDLREVVVVGAPELVGAEAGISGEE